VDVCGIYSAAQLFFLALGLQGTGSYSDHIPYPSLCVDLQVSLCASPILAPAIRFNVDHNAPAYVLIGCRTTSGVI
jgi:hypothetical protein